MQNDSEKILQHYEKEFGKYISAKKITLNESKELLSILEFNVSKVNNSHVILTHGLSKHSLNDNKFGLMRQELMFYIKEQNYIRDVKAIIAIIADMMMKDNLALEFGQVLNFKKPVIKNFEGFCAITPMYQDPNFHVVKNGMSPIAIVCLFSLFKEEIDFINKKGYELFQKLIIEQGSELWSLERQSILLK